MDLNELKRRLIEAEGAYHRLMIGDLTASVRHDGKQVTYTQSSAASLLAYINGLKQQIAAAEGTGSRSARRTFYLTPMDG